MNWNRFATNGNRFRPEHPEYRRVHLINIILSGMVTLYFGFFLLDVLVFKLYLVALNNFFAGILSISTLIYFHKRDRVQFTAVMTLLIGVYVQAWLLYQLEYRYYSLFWITGVPLPAYFLLGRKFGGKFVFIFYSLVIIFVGIRFEAWQSAGFDHKSLFNIFFATLALVLLVSYYELTRSEAGAALEQKNAELEKLSKAEKEKSESERAQLRQELIQAQKMESIGRLAGGIAHDFNNLLTAILGNAELSLMSISSDNEIHPQLKMIKQAAESAADLTKQLLAFSRKQIIDPKIVNLNDVIENMHKMLVRIIGENIALKAIPQPGLNVVKVDVPQIQQIIINLAVNAKDAMPGGGILSLETANVILDKDYCMHHPYCSIGEYVMLSITDTGTGISDEAKAHLFEPFFTTKEIGKGTGLGLATVYGAVKQNGGSINVYSELGKGTCFKVFFPVAEEEGMPHEFITKAEHLPGGTETVLIAEDNPLVLHFTSSVLVMLGYNVRTVSSGEDAVVMVEKSKEKIDLFMTDVILSGMNGKQAAEQIRRLRPGIQILFNSGYTENTIVANGVLDQGLDFIGKPFSAYELARKVREILDRGQPLTEFE